MRKWLLFLACCPVALAQIESNVLTVTATRSLNLQPDQASLMVNVTSSVNTALADVLTALQSTNITSANLTAVGTSTTGSGSASGNNEAWYWTFTVTVPLSGLKAILASLAMVQQSLPAAQNPMTVAYFLQGASFSPQLLASNPCPYTAVFSDAQTQAKNVAAAAGVTLGPVVALSDGSGITTQPAVEYGVLEAVSLASGAYFVEGQPAAPAAPSCTMVVKFKLGQ
jgi:uncharacterized protein YggE